VHLVEAPQDADAKLVAEAVRAQRPGREDATSGGRLVLREWLSPYLAASRKGAGQ
jgi:hypothetical protein